MAGTSFRWRWLRLRSPWSVSTVGRGQRGLAASPIPANQEKVENPNLFLELCQFFHRPKQIARLRQNGVLQNRLIGDEGVSRGNSLYRRIQMMEQLVGNAGCDFGAVSPA